MRGACRRGKDDGFARDVSKKKGGGLCDGMAGAKLRVLNDSFHDLGIRGGRGCDSFAAVAGDGDDAGGLQLRGGGQGAGRRGGGDVVQDLRRLGVHPGALPCGQNDD